MFICKIHKNKSNNYFLVLFILILVIYLSLRSLLVLLISLLVDRIFLLFESNLIFLRLHEMIWFVCILWRNSICNSNSLISIITINAILVVICFFTVSIILLQQLLYRLLYILLTSIETSLLLVIILLRYDFLRRMLLLWIDSVLLR